MHTSMRLRGFPLQTGMCILQKNRLQNALPCLFPTLLYAYPISSICLQCLPVAERLCLWSRLLCCHTGTCCCYEALFRVSQQTANTRGWVGCSGQVGDSPDQERPALDSHLFYAQRQDPGIWTDIVSLYRCRYARCWKSGSAPESLLSSKKKTEKGHWYDYKQEIPWNQDVWRLFSLFNEASWHKLCWDGYRSRNTGKRKKNAYYAVRTTELDADFPYAWWKGQFGGGAFRLVDQCIGT